MRFKLKVWKNYYDRIHCLGQYINDTNITIDENNVSHPAKIKISRDERINLQNDLDDMVSKCSNYLNGCNVLMPKSYWEYEKKDKTTWASDESFKYHHLMKYPIFRCSKCGNP